MTDRLDRGERINDFFPKIDEKFKMNEFKLIEKIFDDRSYLNKIKEDKRFDRYLYENLIINKNFNPRLDEFIRERIPLREENLLPELDRIELPQLRELRRLDESTKFKSFANSGFTADTKKYFGPRPSLSINGQPIESSNGEYTEVHFTPDGRGNFTPSKMTDSLAKGIEGVAKMIDAIDSGTFISAQLFVGRTNLNMALIAQRLGFVIVDECRNPDGTINKDLKSFTVVGKLEDIKAKVEEFRKAGTDQKLAQRNQRLKLKPSPA